MLLNKEMGQQAKNIKEVDLGLSLAKQLFELHGGRIWVESEGEEKVSTFKFIIPL